jgi:bifunctional non-homologous end joining protein LigD
MPHPERVLFPECGVRREELAAHYLRAADVLVREASGRAVTVVRYPHGIGEAGFFQKHERTPGREDDPIRIEDPSDLVRWVALGAVEFHLPLGRLAPTAGVDALHDWAVMDLDPHAPAGWREVVAVSRALTTVLAHAAIPWIAKTSGQSGVHVLIAIVPTPARAATEAMERVARLTRRLVPDVATVARRVRDRGPRVYLDYLQNAPTRTMAAVFGVRAVEPAPVSWPVQLDRLVDVAPDDFTVRSARGVLLPDWNRGPPVDLLSALDAAGIPSVQDLRRADRAVGAGGERTKTSGRR